MIDSMLDSKWILQFCLLLILTLFSGRRDLSLLPCQVWPPHSVIVLFMPASEISMHHNYAIPNAELHCLHNTQGNMNWKFWCVWVCVSIIHVHHIFWSHFCPTASTKLRAPTMKVTPSPMMVEAERQRRRTGTLANLREGERIKVTYTRLAE